jgi:hypothetical protein
MVLVLVMVETSKITAEWATILVCIRKVQSKIIGLATRYQRLSRFASVQQVKCWGTTDEVQQKNVSEIADIFCKRKKGKFAPSAVNSPVS